MNSRVYECQVMHARFVPKPHRFAYRIFMIAVDLDELPALDRNLRLFSFGSRNLYSFRDADYFPVGAAHNPSALAASPSVAADPAATGLKARVLATLAARNIDLGPRGRIELVTLPRVFGYLFNPVSFYFCHDSTGACVATIPEVTNTFREVKPFFLGPENRRDDGSFHLRVPKHFYVSPFSDVDVSFDFTLRAPEEKLNIRIDDYAGGQRTLTSTLLGKSRPLTDATLAWFTLKYPLVTLRTISLIHWHALRLYLKKIPWFSKAARPADQRDLRRPHASLTHAAPSTDA